MTARTAKHFKPPGLSSREVDLLARWERARKRAVSLQDIRQIVGDPAAKKVAHSLVRKHALERVAKGTYLVRPFRTLLRPTTSSSAALVAVLLQSEPHYLGGLWALTMHGLTDQQHVSIIDAFVTRRHKAGPPALAQVRFHILSPASMAYGMEATEIEQIKVRLSDPERTLLDLLDYARIAGSLGHALEMVERNLDRVDADKLSSYAVRGSRGATCQRLGVLLERRQVSPRAVAPLHARARSRNSLLSLWPGELRKGRLNTRWNVIENDR